MNIKKLISSVMAIGFASTLMAIGVSADTIEIPDDAQTFNGHYYVTYAESMSWTDAKEYCESLGGHLATISNANEQQFVEGLMNGTDKSNYWLGGYREENGNTWYWVDNTSFQYTNWDDSQPDNFNNEEYYIRLVNTNINYDEWDAHYGKWNDTADNSTGEGGEVPITEFGFICEWDSNSTETTTSEVTTVTTIQETTTSQVTTPQETTPQTTVITTNETTSNTTQETTNITTNAITTITTTSTTSNKSNSPATSDVGIANIAILLGIAGVSAFALKKNK